MALQIFHHLLGGGECLNMPPAISAPIGRKEKREKVSESSSKMITKLFQSNFRSGHNCGIQGPKMPQISSFSRLPNNFSENSMISGNIIGTANLKTAFEGELNSHRNITVRFDLRSTVYPPEAVAYLLGGGGTS